MSEHPEGFGIDTGLDYVLAWSSRRLPFEPRGEMKAFRGELRSAVSHLSADEDQGLLATYSSPQRDVCDVENVLIYNVGTSAFRKAARNELAFQRSFQRGPAHEHTYRYEIVARPIQLAAETEPLATWRSEGLERFSEATSLTSLWWAIRRGEIVVASEKSIASSVRLELEIRGPRSINLAGIVKVAVDASVVALQEPNLASQTEAVRRIASRLGVGPTLVEAALVDPRRRVFSQGPVVRLRGDDAIHWNPADDSCVAGVLRYVPSERWEVRGELFLAPEA